MDRMSSLIQSLRRFFHCKNYSSLWKHLRRNIKNLFNTFLNKKYQAPRPTLLFLSKKKIYSVLWIRYRPMINRKKKKVVSR